MSECNWRVVTIDGEIVHQDCERDGGHVREMGGHVREMGACERDGGEERRESVVV